jgi:hypothetical protein
MAAQDCKEVAVMTYPKRMNGVQAGEENARKFCEWIKAHDTANDWRNYFRDGKLIKAEAYREIGFHRNAFASNEMMKQLLADLEARCAAGKLFPLEEGEVISGGPSDASAQGSTEDKVLIQKLHRALALKDSRIKELEERLAVKNAEVSHLRAQLNEYKHIDDHLARTGRMIRP